jgi:separase
MTQVVEAFATQSPILSWSSDDRVLTLSRTLRSIIKVDKAWLPWVAEMPGPERAAVLEHILRLTATRGSTQQHLDDPTVAALLKLYTPEKHPIRRLRVLLHVLSQILERTDDCNLVFSRIDEVLFHIKRDEFGDDAGLRPYLPHFEAHQASLRALLAINTDLGPAMQAAISSWKSIVDGCAAKNDVFGVIDDPEKFNLHLRCIGQFASLKGEMQLLLTALTLSIRISGLISTDKTELVLGNNLLAVHYTAVGLFSQALKTIQATATLVDQEDVSAFAIANYHLARAEYYVGIGDVDET